MNKKARWSLSLLIFVGACAVSAALAFGNYYYYQWISGYIHFKTALPSALLFSAFLIVIGMAFIIWKPRFYGFQIGESIKRWKLVLYISAAVCAFTAICLLLTPRTPFSGANWIVEMVVVPFSEELIWRGLIFSIMYKLLGQLFSQKASLTLTVVFSSVSFGLAHVSNVLVYSLSFVMLQMIFAAVASSGMGYLRAKTKSIYPAMILHALFNFIAIIF